MSARCKLLFCLILSLSFAIASAESSDNPLVGKKAPNFNLSLLTGGKSDLDALRARQSTIIFFWATWCTRCSHELQELNKKVQELRDNQIKIVLVDVQEDSKAVESYVNRNGIRFDVFLDKDMVAADKYK